MSTNRQLAERLWKMRDWLVDKKGVPKDRIDPLIKDVEDRLCPSPPKRKDED